jgi:endonuclease/exonuclease/phosphatase family metal-dependent hydrolase/predicted esterase
MTDPLTATSRHLPARGRAPLLIALALAAALGGCRAASAPAAGADSTAGRTPAPTLLSVVTLNIWHDQRDWPARFEYMVRELRRLEPDVIALQEVLQHENLPNQAETFARRLGYQYHFTSVDAEDRPRRYGNAILTRHPVLARGWKALEPRDDYRNAAHLRIDFHGTEVDLYNTHLHHTGEGGGIRRRQLEDLLGFIGETRGAGPVILAGDFNAPVEAPEMRLLDERFVDAYGAVHTDAEARARTTLNPHVGHEPRRIDHIYFERGAWEPVGAEIILDQPDAAGTWASDHFGVLARFRRIDDANAAPGAPAEPGVQQAHALNREVTRTHRGSYLLFLPPGYDARQRWPLILFLHGAGERGADLDRVRIHGPPKLVEQRPDEFPFIVVSPQVPADRIWSVAWLDALLEEVGARYAVDPDRIYVTGLSMGGYGTWHLAFEFPHRFAAIAPISGGGTITGACTLRHLPVWVFHGALDEVVPPSRSEELVNRLRGCDGHVRYTRYEDAGHDAWTRTYEDPELYRWFLQHRRGAPGGEGR